LKSQILNIDETGLFWEKMPARTYMANEEKAAPRRSVAKDRLKVLIGGSATSDFKLKHMLVCHSKNPRALKDKAKGMLPVITKSNSKACVVGTILQNWFSLYFVPAVRIYCI
jgi:hypothetical protein